MLADMSDNSEEEKSFFQRLKESKGEKLSECPFECGNTHEVYQTPEGLIDCWRCGTRPIPEKLQEVDIRTGQLKNDKERERAEESRSIRDCLDEDRRRGQPGGGSSKGPSRKKQVKRSRARVEQDAPVFGTGAGGGSIVVKRIVERIHKADKRVKLYIPDSFKTELEVEAFRRGKIDSTKWPLVRVIRTALWKHAKKIDMVKPFEYGQGDRVELQIMLYPDEKQLLDQCCEAKGCSHGEFVAACFRELSK